VPLATPLSLYISSAVIDSEERAHGCLLFVGGIGCQRPDIGR
jgi:hypothetical protein